jgi:hypothetical protein
MADIGGLIKTLLMIAQFMYMLNNTDQYYGHLINMESKNNISDKKQLNTRKFSENDNRSSQNPMSKINFKPISLAQPNLLRITKNMQQQQQPKLEFLWYESLFCYAFSNKIKRNDIRKAISVIKEKLSIETYLKMICEIEALRKIEVKIG